MLHDRAIVTMKVIHGLSNRAIFYDIERLQTQILRSGHSLMLNISEMAKDTAIVTMEVNRNRKAFKRFHFSMTLTDL